MKKAYASDTLLRFSLLVTVKALSTPKFLVTKDFPFFRAHSVKKYLLSIFYNPGPILGIPVSKTDISDLKRFTCGWGE